MEILKINIMNQNLENSIDLFIRHGKSLHDAACRERQQLPLFAALGVWTDVNALIDSELGASENQINTLRESLWGLRATPFGEKSQSCEEILSEAGQMIEGISGRKKRGLAMLKTLKRISEMKITRLNSLLRFAREMGEEPIYQRLRELLQEQQAIAAKVSELSQNERRLLRNVAREEPWHG